ncbi:hypothetical protein GCM10010430_03340 [Kitasatospora cystarginea]|uniref:Uncharacterized protein n=1 Tax=Kitasatospora cystarginea TaxID=58350 RepID=A0ABP5Q8X5_9ACTN
MGCGEGRLPVPRPTYAQLALLPGSAPRSGWVSGATREAPLPCRLDVLSLLGPAAEESVRDPHGDQVGAEPILGTLLSWARLIFEEGNYYRPSGGWATIGALVAFLADRDVIEWVVRQPWADEYADEIATVHRQLIPLARLQPRRHPMPCRARGANSSRSRPRTAGPSSAATPTAAPSSGSPSATTGPSST